jgi:hypothetical protein
MMKKFPKLGQGPTIMYKEKLEGSITINHLGFTRGV